MQNENVDTNNNNTFLKLVLLMNNIPLNIYDKF